MRRLRARSVCVIEAGLTVEEIAYIECRFGFEFADDHRAFLSAGLPVNTQPPPRAPGVIYTDAEPWPDWRNSDPGKLQGMLDWPKKGVVFDVEHNGFWPEAWGPRPPTTRSAIDTAEILLATVPTIVPIYGHRYLPADRGRSHHPVLSMYQTDIIYYGLALAEYIDQEFGRTRSDRQGKDPSPHPTVDFWRDLVQ